MIFLRCSVGFPLRAFPDSLAIAIFRGCRSDFVVEVLLGFVPEGFGSHSWLIIEKIIISTDEAVARLASHLKLHNKDVGYAGAGKERYCCSDPATDDCASVICGSGIY